MTQFWLWQYLLELLVCLQQFYDRVLRFWRIQDQGNQLLLSDTVDRHCEETLPLSTMPSISSPDFREAKSCSKCLTLDLAFRSTTSRAFLSTDAAPFEVLEYAS